jgi:glycosyltransferase 2 family protein
VPVTVTLTCVTETGADVDPTPAARPRRVLLRRLLRVVFTLVALAALALCVVAVVDQWGSVEASLRRANVTLLVVAGVVSLAFPPALAVAWWRCLAVFGTHVRLRDALRWYVVGELGKYLPGGIWPVVGRGEMAARDGVGRSVAYTSTLVSMAAMCVAASGVGALLVPFLLADGHGVGLDLLVLLVLPAGAVAVHPAVFGRILDLARKVTKGRLDLAPPSWADMGKLVAWNVPAWVAIGLASALTAQALGETSDPARIAFAAVLAWIVGFLAVPVPAGAGVREVVFVAVCGLAAGPAVAVAAFSRLFLLAADLLVGTVGLGASRRRSPVRTDPDAAPVPTTTGGPRT